MLDGSVLALADQRRTGKHDGEHGHIVDDLHDRPEPGFVELRVEPRSQRQIDGQSGNASIALRKGAHLVGDDGLDVAAAREDLAHARGVHIELDRRSRRKAAVAALAGKIS